MCQTTSKTLIYGALVCSRWSMQWVRQGGCHILIKWYCLCQRPSIQSLCYCHRILSHLATTNFDRCINGCSWNEGIIYHVTSMKYIKPFADTPSCETWKSWSQDLWRIINHDQFHNFLLLINIRRWHFDLNGAKKQYQKCYQFILGGLPAVLIYILSHIESCHIN